MATVERWTFVNMFVTENFAVILAVTKVPTRVAFWVLDCIALVVAAASVSYWVVFFVSAASVSPLLFLSSGMRRFEEETCKQMDGGR